VESLHFKLTHEFLKSLKLKYKQERNLVSASRSVYTLAVRFRGSSVRTELSHFRKTKNELQIYKD